MSLDTSALSSLASSPAVSVESLLRPDVRPLTDEQRHHAGLPTDTSPVLSPSGRWLPALQVAEEEVCMHLPPADVRGMCSLSTSLGVYRQLRKCTLQR
jgi:hypothetical protein